MEMRCCEALDNVFGLCVAGIQGDRGLEPTSSSRMVVLGGRPRQVLMLLVRANALGPAWARRRRNTVYVDYISRMVFRSGE